MVTVKVSGLGTTTGENVFFEYDSDYTANLRSPSPSAQYVM